MRANFSHTLKMMLFLLISISLVLTTASSPIPVVVKISGPLLPDRDVYDYLVSQNGKYTVFTADGTADYTELFSVLSWGGERVLLSPGITATSQVNGFLITPDSLSVLYWVGHPEAESRADCFYLVPITGGVPEALDCAIPTDLFLEWIDISTDSQFVYYVLTEETPSSYHRLYALKLDGSSSSMAISPDEDCLDLQFRLMPNADGVVYGREKTMLQGSEMVHVDPLGNVTPIRTVNGTFNGGDITPNSEWVIFIEHQNMAGTWDKLYGYRFDGGTITELSDDMILPGNVKNFKISGDSEYVVYKADADVDEVYEIYTTQIDPVAHYNLIPAMVAGGDVVDYKIVNSSLGTLGVVYKADQLVDEKYDLGFVTITGSSAYHLSIGMIANGDVTDFDIFPNGIGVVFIADYGIDEMYNLWLSAINEEDPYPLGIESAPGVIDWPAFTDVSNFAISPNNWFIVFQANFDDSTVNELYFIENGDYLLRKKINLPLVAGGLIESYTITGDSKGVVYHANQDSQTSFELYSSYNRYPVYMPMFTR